jgi:hypothetical protein
VRRSRLPWALAVLAVLATGCRFGVTAEVEVSRDGSGTAALVLELDAALLEELDELDVDPTAELSAVAAGVPAWQLTREVGADDALRLTLRHEAGSPAALTEAFRELTAGLTDTDPALVVDLDLAVDDEGAAELDGTVQLRPPIGPGVVLDEAAEAELAALTADTVEASLVVSLPGTVTASDADRVDGRTATWEVVPGEPRTLSATAAAPSRWSGELLAAAAVAGALLLLSAVTLALVVRRRR